MKSAALEARNTAEPANSSGVPQRPAGVRATISSLMGDRGARRTQAKCYAAAYTPIAPGHYGHFT